MYPSRVSIFIHKLLVSLTGLEKLKISVHVFRVRRSMFACTLCTLLSCVVYAVILCKIAYVYACMHSMVE